MKAGWLLCAGLSLAAACTPSPASAPPPAATPALWRWSATPANAATPTAAATPVIIASPTPSATPVTHVVQKGETLIGLAVRYGVSLADLQRANPNLAPEALTIGASVIIPVDGQTPAAPSLSAATPAPLEFAAPACYGLASGAQYCLVMARNPGALALEAVTARVTLAGADGLPLADAIAYPVANVLGPAAALPLVAYFPAVTGSVAAVGVTALTAWPLAEAATRSVALEVAGLSGAASPSGWTARGQVHNATTRPAVSARLALVLSDAAGRLVGVGQLIWPDGLAAGAARDFEITAAVLGGTVDHYQVLAEGQP